MNLVQKALAKTTYDFDLLTLTPEPGKATDWESLVNLVTNWVFVLAGVIAFFYLVWSGFIYLTAGGNPDAAKKGQQGIINAVIGLVIIFLAFFIVRAIVGLLG